MSTLIAVDTGGTFTDLALLDGDGLRVHKVRSTPDDPSLAILTGIRELLGKGAVDVIHGSTVATNALLERKGARVALLTTAGFEDLLLIGRQTRAELYRLSGAPRVPLMGSDLVFGVRERIGAGGEIVTPLTEEEADGIVREIAAAKPDAIAICLLHSYVNAEHERKLSQGLRATGISVSASHEILPEYREFERASTTAVNAYVSPVMSRYLDSLSKSLLPGSLRVMQSSGGFVSAEEAGRIAASTVLSGPAGGAVGALAIATASGFPRVIAFDMGGTSTDVTLLDGTLPTTAESVIGDFPVRIPSLDIHTIGAGGGSIAVIEAEGVVRVGPRSAGAVPGPVCYGLGEELTVTDANLLLGRLDADSFLGGRMTLDIARAQRVAEQMAAELKVSVAEMAEGVVRIANSNIERALRVVSVQRGYDPRDFALLAFGGAGGMHACDLANSLDIETVLVPEHAGILSALGMLLANYDKQYSRALLRGADAVPQEELEGLFTTMLEQARADLLAAAFNDDSIRLERALDLRYKGQSYELTVPFDNQFRESFHAAHKKRYGYHDEKRECEIVALRLKAIGITEKPTLQRSLVVNPREAVPARTGVSIFDGVSLATPVFAREALQAGMSGYGPALIAGAQASTVVPPGWVFTVDGAGTLVMTRRAR